MSGGSYNYLYGVYAEDLTNHRSDLDNMIERLRSLGWHRELAKSEAIATKLDEIDKLIAELENQRQEISDVWQAVEWNDSNDGSALFDQLQAEYARENKKS